jgi:hypothetical protein
MNRRRKAVTFGAACCFCALAYLICKGYGAFRPVPIFRTVELKDPSRVFTNLTAEQIKLVGGGWTTEEPFVPSKTGLVSQADIRQIRYLTACKTISVLQITGVRVDDPSNVLVYLRPSPPIGLHELQFLKDDLGWHIRGELKLSTSNTILEHTVLY